jgi:hypothetical protein
LFPSDRPPSILFAKKFPIHDSFIATPPQKMRGTLRYLTGPRFRHRIEAVVERFSDMQGRPRPRTQDNDAAAGQA